MALKLEMGISRHNTVVDFLIDKEFAGNEMPDGGVQQEFVVNNSSRVSARDLPSNALGITAGMYDEVVPEIAVFLIEP